MPHRPPKKAKKAKRRYIPGCKKLMGDDAKNFLQDQLLLKTMEEKLERHLDTVEDGEETVMVSIGHTVHYAKTSYVAHIYFIANFDNPGENGWVIHLWHPGLVLGKHKVYKNYMTQMSQDLGIDLWNTGL